MSATSSAANEDGSNGRVSDALASLVPRSLRDSASSLEQWQEYLELAIFGFGVPLTIGCIAEVWDWKESPWLDTLWRLCVAVGVAGETVCAMIHSSFSARHRQVTNARDSEQQFEIEKLRRATAEANERASSADLLAAEANKRAAEAAERAAAADVRSREAQYRLLPPELHPERQAAFVKALAPLSGRGVSVVIVTDFADPLNSRAVADMANLLGAAEWPVDWEYEGRRTNPRGTKYANISGWLVEIDARDKAAVSAAAAALDEALVAYGYESQVVAVHPPDADDDPDKFMLFDEQRGKLWLIPFIRF